MTTPDGISTGRLHQPLPAPLRRILFGAGGPPAGDATLRHQVQVDRAWAVMLGACGLAETAEVADFLRQIHNLEASGFRALVDREPVRGLYLLYEGVLAEQGATLAGDLQRARSRNDLNATIVRMRLRAPLVRQCVQTLRLVDSMLRLSRRTSDVLMPVFTHGQQALAGSVGHYLAGAAEELLLDARWLWSCWDELQACPLGAGAVCGTALPIDADLVARLLGFDRPVGNSLRAVASRRVVLEVLSAASMSAVTLSRISTDVLAWCSEALRFARLPDRLVGSSSHMPQKRNLFLLEHVQSRAASAQGALVAAWVAMASKPFTNGVAVGTEAVRAVWAPLSDVADALVILRAVLDGLEFDRETMERSLREGATGAAELAELLVECGMSFRRAHHSVGDLVSDAERRGIPFLDAAVEAAAAAGVDRPEAALQPRRIVLGREQGGGTGARSLANQIEGCEATVRRLRKRLASIRARHREASHALSGRVTEILARDSATSPPCKENT